MTPPVVEKETPARAEGVVRRKRKLLSSGGQKWFKGSPRKSSSRSNQGSPAGFKVACRSNEGTSTPPVLHPLLVQIISDGDMDHVFSVFDKLFVFSKGGDEYKQRGKQHRISLKNTLKRPDEEEEGVKKLPKPVFQEIDEYDLSEAPPLPNAYIRWMERAGEELSEEVEYDVDEEDSSWLELINDSRRNQSHPIVVLTVMEYLMDRLEKESYLQMQSTGMDQRPVIDDDAVCCICMDGECQNSNAILFCDVCNLAVHQECYGVPYIPEGQWLCRRCLQSPSRAVDCVLCPNKGGAFKQTDDGRWAHVVCAIWIPEVCFANTVFLEPVDSVNNIPPARWRLGCFICKYKGRGACIQCHKSNCYIAFHVTCAQYAGLCMKMETVRIGSTVTVKKTAYCDNHAPAEFIRSRDGDSPTVRQKLKATRKMLAEKRSAIPMVSIPTIPPDLVSQITSSVTFSFKKQFIKRLMSYWKLKRIQRNGVPLLRRLQAASSVSHHHTSSPTSSSQLKPLKGKSWQGDYKYLMRLRQDLEKARLLCELIRKREKLKRELVIVREEEWLRSSQPLTIYLLRIIEELSAKDVDRVFEEPVDLVLVPDYKKVIVHPMDLLTMKQKAQSYEYCSVLALERDFELMIRNCLLYNTKDTVFYKAAMKLQKAGHLIFSEAHKKAKLLGFDYDNDGLFIDDPTGKRNRLVAEQQIEERLTWLTSKKAEDYYTPNMKARFIKEVMDRAESHIQGHSPNKGHFKTKLLDEGRAPPALETLEFQPTTERALVTDTESENGNQSSRSREESPIPAARPPSTRSSARKRRPQSQSSSWNCIDDSATANATKSFREAIDFNKRKAQNRPVPYPNRKYSLSSPHYGNDSSTGSPTKDLREAIRLKNKHYRRKKQESSTTDQSSELPFPSNSNNNLTLENHETRYKVIQKSGKDGESCPKLRRESSNKVYSTRNTNSRPSNSRRKRSVEHPFTEAPQSSCNGLSNSMSWSPKTPRGQIDSSSTGFKRKGSENSMKVESVGATDSFTAYRSGGDTEMNSEGDSANEEEDDEELLSEEEEANSTDSTTSENSSSEDSDTSSSASSLSKSNWRSRKKSDEDSNDETPKSPPIIVGPNRCRRLRLQESPGQGEETDSEEEGRVVDAHPQRPVSLAPLSLVWAECKDGLWCPALIIDPSMSQGFTQNGVTIPCPPREVLCRRPARRKSRDTSLVLFFDNNIAWEWVTRSQLEPLGLQPSLDKRRLDEGKKVKSVRRAYEKALLHQHQVDAGLHPTLLSPDSD